MKTVFKAFESDGIINSNEQLLLENPLEILPNTSVHFIVNDIDLNENEWLKSAGKNPAFDFLNDPEEDFYL
jgi:hypothetical protein